MNNLEFLHLGETRYGVFALASQVRRSTNRNVIFMWHWQMMVKYTFVLEP